MTAHAGLGGDRDWPTSAAWADLDNDGDLDLYVCHYLKWDAGQPAALPGPATTRQHVLRPAPFRRAAGPRLPQRRRPVRRRDRSRRASSTATAAAWASSRPTSTATARPTCSSPTIRRPTTSSATRAASGSPRRGWSRAWRPTPAAAIWREWASPAATSTATAGSTWP